MDIRTVFADLLDNTGNPGQRVRIRIDQASSINVYAACVFPQRNLVLEIGPIKNAWFPKGFEKPRINGLRISLNADKPLPDSDTTLLMELQDEQALDIFSVFTERVCDELDKLEKPELTIKAVIALIEHWKSFFSRSSDTLGETKQTGLYGELYCLHNLSMNGIRLADALHAWTGSRKTNQDFEFGRVALEVKSSVAVDTSRIMITNARQLDDNGLDDLFLVRLTFDVKQGESNTLPALISGLRKSLRENAPDTKLEFEEKLIEAGYRDKHISHYIDRSYSEREFTFFRITAGFPRILESQLPQGVLKVSYEIGQDSCMDYIIFKEKVFESVRNSCV